jgi:hypothetical protein
MQASSPVKKLWINCGLAGEKLGKTPSYESGGGLEGFAASAAMVRFFYSRA